jgi:hypothetical protein
VCAGIVGDCLVGPHVLPHRLTGNHCRDFLLHDMAKLLKDVLLAFRARMWYMHDCASAHFSLTVRDVLNNTYHYRGPTSGLHARQIQIQIMLVMILWFFILIFAGCQSVRFLRDFLTEK